MAGTLGNEVTDGGETILTVIRDHEPVVAQMADGILMVVPAAKVPRAVFVLPQKHRGRTDTQKERASLLVVVIAPSPPDERVMTIEVKGTFPVRKAGT